MLVRAAEVNGNIYIVRQVMHSFSPSTYIQKLVKVLYEDIGFLPPLSFNTSIITQLHDDIHGAKAGYSKDFTGLSYQQQYLIYIEGMKLRSMIRENDSDSLTAYCNFLREHGTDDCTLLSIPSSVNSETYITYGFKEINNKLSVEAARYSLELDLYNTLLSLFRNERVFIDLYKQTRNESYLWEFVKLSLYKLSIVNTEDRSYLEKALDKFRSYTAYLLPKIYKDNYSSAMFHLDKCVSFEASVNAVKSLSFLLRRSHIKMNKQTVGYDFDMVLQIGTTDGKFSAETLIPNTRMVKSMENDIKEGKNVYIITHNKKGHKSGVIEAFLNLHVLNAGNVIVKSTKKHKSEKILKYGISVFYDDKREVLADIESNAKIVHTYENIQLYLITLDDVSIFVATEEEKKIHSQKLYSRREYNWVECAWYTTETNMRNEHACVGCIEKIPHRHRHTFDNTCQVKCSHCSRQTGFHDTYTRKNCLPATRIPLNKTKLKMHIWRKLLHDLDKRNAYYQHDDDLHLHCKRDDVAHYCRLAKYLAVASEYDKIHVHDGTRVEVHEKDPLAKTLGKVANSKNLKQITDLVA